MLALIRSSRYRTGNRAAAWYMVGAWKECIADCEQARSALPPLLRLSALASTGVPSLPRTAPAHSSRPRPAPTLPPTRPSRSILGTSARTPASRRRSASLETLTPPARRSSAQRCGRLPPCAAPVPRLSVWGAQSQLSGNILPARRRSTRRPLAKSSRTSSRSRCACARSLRAPRLRAQEGTTPWPQRSSQSA